VGNQEGESLGVAGLGLQDRPELPDGFVTLTSGQQETGQVHAERDIVRERGDSVPQARDHGMLVIHTVTPVLFVWFMQP
jgi:hypothetical protein